MIKLIFIAIIAMTIMMVPSAFAETSRYELIEVSLDKNFVQQNEMITVKGQVKIFDEQTVKEHPVLSIIRPGGGTAVNDSVSINPDGSFEKSWVAGHVYKGLWGNSGTYLFIIHYGYDEYIEFEFEYCDGTDHLCDDTYYKKIINGLHDDIIKMQLDPHINVIENTIPSWVKTNTGWCSDGLITDIQFIGTIEYLIQEKIIRIN